MSELVALRKKLRVSELYLMLNDGLIDLLQRENEQRIDGLKRENDQLREDIATASAQLEALGERP